MNPCMLKWRHDLSFCNIRLKFRHAQMPGEYAVS